MTVPGSTPSLDNGGKPVGWTYEVHELSEGFSAIVYDERGHAIADHLSEEHARLIATAPELLEALAGLLANLTEGNFISETRIDAARAALNKALGK